jgi:PqqD family protein of HPr-rel-A system
MWRVIPGQELYYREWNDEFVVYNNLSGDTHLLGISAIVLLNTLKERAANEDLLVTSLCDSLQLDHDAEVEQQVANVLESLKSLSLVENLS